MFLYKCFRFSEVIVQMFITVRRAVQGSFRALPPSLFMSSYDQDGELGEPPPPPHTHTHTTLDFFFGVNLDFLDFSGGIFNHCNVRSA